MDELRKDRRLAEEYVRALFQHLLERKATTDEEVNYWTQEIVSGRSEAEVLRLFAVSEEHKLLKRRQQGNATQYPNGHFYSPVVNLEEVQAQEARIFGRHAPLGIDIEPGQQLALLETLSRFFGEMPFSDKARPPFRYRYDNTSYGFGDACIYWGMLGHLRPNRIVEVGSGFTSALALDAIEHFGLGTRCTFIDPNPQLLQQVAAPIDPRHTVVADLVQNIDPAMVEELGVNDLLFIDSSHVVKTGSDVHFELMDLLPRLKPGVVVHFHDTFYPFEYPRPWVLGDNYSWNELYVLHAFLMYNNAFKVIYFNDFVGREHADAVRAMLPREVASRVLLNPGGGLWLRRM